MRALTFVSAIVCTVAYGFSLPSQAQSDCARRSPIVSVFDERGNEVTGLSKENFRAKYHRSLVVPSSVSYTSGPRRVTILLDASGSMSGHETGNHIKWQIARAAAWELVTALPQGSKVSLITFSTTAEIRAAMSADRKSILEWLNGETGRDPESAKGRTALFTAIETAIAQLKPSEPGDAIYAITDGGENASRTRESQVEKDLLGSNIRLFGLIVDDGNRHFAEEEERNSGTLLRMARKSGGWVGTLGSVPLLPVYDARLQERIRNYSRGLSVRISNFYSLGITLLDSPSKTQEWDISVVDEGGGKLKHSVVNYQSEILPCAN